MTPDVRERLHMLPMAGRVAGRGRPAYTVPSFDLGPACGPLAGAVMHYPRRISKIHRIRKLGFRARMKTSAGRKMINRKRRLGRVVTPV